MKATDYIQLALKGWSLADMKSLKEMINDEVDTEKGVNDNETRIDTIDTTTAMGDVVVSNEKQIDDFQKKIEELENKNSELSELVKKLQENNTKITMPKEDVVSIDDITRKFM